MSFIDNIVGFGKKALGFLGGDGLGSTLARTAITAYALNRVVSSINRKNNQQPPDPGVRIQLPPNTEAKVPVVYGRASLGGIITDAQLANDNKTLWLCMTLSEKTGVKLSDGIQSSFTFKRVFRDGLLVNFQSDGTTVSKLTDTEGGEMTSVNGLMSVYCFNGNSQSPVPLDGFVNNGLQAAYSLFPDWGSQHQMNDLIFAIVKIQYSPENDVRGIGEWKFELENSMTLPGDCLNDYMQSTTYGAGISSTEIWT